MKIIAIASLAAALSYAPKSEASDFDIVAAGCLPISSSLGGNYYVSAGPGIAFAPGQTTPIYLTCHIPQPSLMAAPSNLEVFATDPTSSPGNYVNASYWKVHKVTGTATLIAGTSSENCAPNTQPRSCNNTFSHAWDPTNYYYYVQVVLVRTGTNNVVFWGVTLW